MTHHTEQFLLFAFILSIFEVWIGAVDIKRTKNSSCSLLDIGVRLVHLGQLENEQNSLNSGLVEIKPQSHTDYFNVCFPSSNTDSSFQKISAFSHVLCRGLGHMTYTSYSKYFSGEQKLALSIDNDTVTCLGHEQELNHCAWCGSHLETCSYLLEISCSDGYKTITAEQGTVSSPGYPNSCFYTLFHEWTVFVPQGHGIRFVFTKISFPMRGSAFSSSNCEVSDAYVEILYGPEDSPRIHKNCAVRYETIVDVPDHTAKVRFFSGLHPANHLKGSNYGTQYGFHLIFQEKEKSSSAALTAYVISTILVIIVLVAAIYYLCPNWSPKRRSLSNDELPEILSDYQYNLNQLNRIRVHQSSPSDLPVFAENVSSSSESGKWNSNYTEMQDIKAIELQSYSRTRSPSMSVEQTVCRRLSRTIIHRSQSSQDEYVQKAQSPIRPFYNDAIPMGFDIYHSVDTSTDVGRSNSDSELYSSDNLDTEKFARDASCCGKCPTDVIPKITIEFVGNANEELEYCN